MGVEMQMGVVRLEARPRPPPPPPPPLLQQHHIHPSHHRHLLRWQH